MSILITKTAAVDISHLYAQSGETRTLFTSGGMVVEGTISGAAIHFVDTVVTSGIIVDDISADAITARTITTSGITVRGGVTASGAVTAYGVSLFQAGLHSPSTISGLFVNTSGLTVAGPSIFTGGLSTPGTISGLVITTSGLTVNGGLTATGVASGTQLNLTSGLIANAISSTLLTATTISGATIAASSGFIGNATSGQVLTAQNSGSLAIWTNLVINRVAGVLPTASGFDTAPTDLANITDGDWTTQTGEAITSRAGTNGTLGNIDIDMGDSYPVLIIVTINGHRDSGDGITTIYIQTSTDGSNYYSTTNPTYLWGGAADQWKPSVAAFQYCRYLRLYAISIGVTVNPSVFHHIYREVMALQLL